MKNLLLVSAITFLIVMDAANAMCIDGAVSSCFIEGKKGTKECISGHWGNCELDEQSPNTPVDITPQGSYRASCDSYRVEGDSLIGRCATIAGTFMTSSLQNYKQCTKDIWNANGNLRCNKGGEPPAGSYQASCDDIWVDAGNLHARCSNGSGVYLQSTLNDYKSCTHNIYGINNNNGTLICGLPRAPDQPTQQQPIYIDMWGRRICNGFSCIDQLCSSRGAAGQLGVITSQSNQYFCPLCSTLSSNYNKVMKWNEIPNRLVEDSCPYQ